MTHSPLLGITALQPITIIHHSGELNLTAELKSTHRHLSAKALGGDLSGVKGLHFCIVEEEPGGGHIAVKMMDGKDDKRAMHSHTYLNLAVATWRSK